MEFRETGLGAATIAARLRELTVDDMVSDGRKWAMSYDAGAEVKAVAADAFAHFMGRNGLDPTLYPSIRAIENDVVAMTKAHLRLPQGGVGTFTSCGTESVMLAVKTARDYARARRPGLERAQFLAPITAHASFFKAAHYFDVELVTVDVDPVTMRADVDDMRAKITDRTVLLVGSAPGYAHGVIDPIEDIAALAQARGVLCHVDACIGGWVLPFLRELGQEVPAFDFALEGVTSMSVDLHKYAFAPKGVSVLLMRDEALREAQYFACAGWTGYSIVNSTMLGSKSAASLAAAWAVMQYLGREGYRAKIAEMQRAKEMVCQTVRSSDELELVGSPDMPLMAFRPTVNDAFGLADALAARGWFVQPTFAFGPSPAHVHLTIDPACARHAEQFCADLLGVAGALEPLSDDETVSDDVLAMLPSVLGGEADLGLLLEGFGVRDGQLPAQHGLLMRVINALDVPTREMILKRFFNNLLYRA